jgi:hypothetical protein
MTQAAAARSVVAMKNGRLTSNGLVIIALTAVVSLATGHLVDLGNQMLGSGPASTFALVGDFAGLVGCAVSAWLGVRYLTRSHACRT